MSETPQNSFENSEEHSPASFEADFDTSELMSPEEHAEIREQVEASYAERNSPRSEAARSVLEEVHALYETPVDVARETQGRTVLVDGKEEGVIDSYVDARGNEWVELGDGRQTMKHQEIRVAEVVETPDTTQTAEEINKTHDSALEAAEIHYQYILAEKNFDKESLGLIQEEQSESEQPEQPNQQEQQDQPGKESGAEIPQEAEEKPTVTEEQSERVESELLQMDAHLRSMKKEAAYIKSSEASNLDGAINELSTLRRRLRNTSNDGIDSVLFGHISQSVDNARQYTYRAAKNESDKRSLVKKAEHVADMARTLDDTRANAPHRDASLDATAMTLKSVLSRLTSTDPRHYNRQKGDFIRLVESSIRELEEVSELNRRGKQLENIVDAVQ